MSYERQEINQFKGLNSAADPSLIEDGFARDILNFRMEKVGKLVSRDGYIYGLFIKLDPDMMQIRDTISPIRKMLENNGIIGIGEMVFSSKWEEIDTDRVMVYMIRAVPVKAEDNIDWNSDAIKYNVMGNEKNHYASFLFSPLTGRYKNLLLANYQLLGVNFNDADYQDLINRFDSSVETSPQSTYKYYRNYKTSARPLFAPNKLMPEYTIETESLIPPSRIWGHEDDDYIKQYVDMNQYRHMLVVSDKINGDKIIEDEANRTDISACEKPKHSLRIRPNCLETFDVDVVKLDFQEKAGEKNYEVKQGMALYKFKLPKMTQITSNNLCDGYFSNIENYPYSLCQSQAEMNYNKSKALIKSLQKLYVGRETDLGDVLHTEIGFSTEETQIFTNANNNSEVDNLFGKLEFEEQEYTDENGEYKKERIADVYVWEEYEIPYYICSGKTYGYKLYRDLDRIFQKTTRAPRIKELSVKDKYGKMVPLGVWRYRFVWDFGDDVYSAPSAELVVPDMLWSAVRDEDIHGAFGYPYKRPFDYEKDDVMKTLVDAPQYYYDIYGSFVQKLVPPLVIVSGNGQPRLTSLGKIVFDLKKKLYDGQQHRFGIKTATGYNDYGGVIDAINSWEVLDYADFATLIVLNSPETVQLKGIAAELVVVAASGRVPGVTIFYEGDLHLDANNRCMVWYKKSGHRDSVRLNKMLDAKNKYYISNALYIQVPMFPGRKRYQKYSVFDPEGRCRLAYQNVWREGPYKDIYIERQIVFPGLFNNHKYLYLSYQRSQFLHELLYAKANVYSDDVFNADDAIYFNVVTYQDISLRPDAPYPVKDTVEYVHVQGSDIALLDWDAAKQFRPFTLFRASKDSRDSLLRTAPVDQQALDRLILSGVAELVLCSPNNVWSIASEYVIRDLDWWTYSVVYSSEHRAEIAGKDILNISNRYGSEVTNPSFTRRAFVIMEPEREISPINVPRPQYLDNLDVRVYLPGTRFVGVEQLTSYFPSSLIHKCPRIALRIRDEDIPRRAKGVKIFRTLATHNNDWDPMSFGLVKHVKIERDADGKAKTVIKKDGQEETYDGFFFFDDVMDSNLDFSDNPTSYDGLRKEIFSRFNIALNERVYYANFTEIYQSLAPRKSMGLLNVDNGHVSTNYIVITGERKDKGFVQPGMFRYAYVYRDEADNLSPEKYVPGTVTVSASPETPQAVVLFMLPSKYDDTIRELEIYRASVVDGVEPQKSDYKYIGSVSPEDEGIFVDDGKEGGKSLGCTKPDIQHYEDGLRWSEPYRPDWIKLNNFAEYRSGDNRGVRITGLASLEGNLVIFKENSIHRVAVQAEDPPLSRTDEISSVVGCIAPNTLIRVDNVLYFLSSQGFTSFDNQTIRNVDGLFGEELKFILQNNPIEYIREASCGYNPYYKELYLNIPMMPSQMTEAIKTRDYPVGTNSQRIIYTDTQEQGGYEDVRIETEGDSSRNWERHTREILGHLYVISLDKQYVTKFAYQTTGIKGVPNGVWDVRTIDPRQVIRKYYTNSFGELRSADILPRAYGVPYAGGIEGEKFVWAGFYIETPYLSPKQEIYTNYDTVSQTIIGGIIQPYPERVYSDKDVVLDARMARQFALMYGEPRPEFPPFDWMPVECEFRSKYFAGSETLLKRIRKGLLNIFSKGEIKVSLITYHEDVFDDRTSKYSELLRKHLQEFLYPPTVDNYDPYKNLVVLGTNTNILTFVPRSERQQLLDVIEDRYGKAVRFAIDIRASRRTQLNSITFYWRPIHTYLH